jgi:predicted Zn-dependent protease with MMP-like domain
MTTDDDLPSLDAIERLAFRALETIPDDLRRHIKDVIIRVTDLPDAKTVEAMELDSPYDLLGLYHGYSLDRQSVHDVRQGIDMINLYRLPMLDYQRESGETLEDVVRHVLIHEVGHHFGFSDEDMERIESEW